MANIKLGILVKVGDGRVILINTMVDGPGGLKLYHREKTVHKGHFFFGTVEAVYEVEKEVKRKVVDEFGLLVTEVVRPPEYTALVRWAGPKYRTSILPVEMLIPANKLQPTPQP